MWSMWLPALVCILAVSINTPIVIRFLQRFKVIDVASERSSHSGVAIRGVGIAVLTGMVPAFLVAIFAHERQSRLTLLIIGVAAVSAAILGAVEDFKGLSVIRRASIQIIIAVVASIALTTLTSTWWIWCIPVAVFVAGYINVTNFMDGIDGISGGHGLLSGMFYVGLGLLTEITWLTTMGGIIAGGFLAFLPWNLSRKGTFLGDTGSYLLGAIIGTTAVAAWMSGINPVMALGPTIIYCIDAGGTLLKRIAKGQTWYKPHRSHVYQRITDVGISHLGSTVIVGIFTIITAMLSLLSTSDTTWNNDIIYVLIIIVGVAYWFAPTLLSKFTEMTPVLVGRRTNS